MNILQTIGNTPLVKLSAANLYAKLEGQNPGGSIKDRAALYMIEQAEKNKKLNKSKIILEATSGNMGIALAMIGAYKNYPVKIIMSEGMSLERRQMIQSFGAQLILTPKNLGTQGALQKAQSLLQKYPGKYWLADQFNNPDNIQAHYHSTAPEILRDLKNIKFLVAGIGTSGTIMGLAKKFKQQSPQTKIIGVIPPPGFQIQGIQNPQQDFAGKIYQNNLIDQIIQVSADQALKTTRKIAQQEGLFVGMSSGAAMHVASQKIKNGKTVVIFPDRGEKYLSTNLFK